MHKGQCLAAQAVQHGPGVLETAGDGVDIKEGAGLDGGVLGAGFENVEQLRVGARAVADGVDDGERELAFGEIVAVAFCRCHLLKGLVVGGGVGGWSHLV